MNDDCNKRLEQTSNDYVDNAYVDNAYYDMSTDMQIYFFPVIDKDGYLHAYSIDYHDGYGRCEYNANGTIRLSDWMRLKGMKWLLDDDWVGDPIDFAEADGDIDLIG